MRTIESHRPNLRPLRRGAWLVLWTLWLQAPAFAAGPSKLEYSVVAVSPLAQKRLESVQDFLAARQWTEAFTVMDEVQREHRRSLVQVDSGRWIGVPRRIAEITANLPPAGLEAYRKRIDPQAEALRQEAEQGTEDDPAPWERIVDEFFASSAGEEALWRLGDLRWRTGDPSSARDLWSRLLPDQGENGAALRYPGSRRPEEVVLARLALCDLLLGDQGAAENRIARLRERFPDSTGTIGGRSGRYADLLTELASGTTAASGPRPAGPSLSAPWLATGDLRTRRLGPLLWSFPLDARPSARPRPVTQIPALWEGLCLVADNRKVFALRARDGQPAWPTGAAGDDGRIFDGDAASGFAVNWPRPLWRPAVDRGGRCFARVGVGMQPNQLSLLKTDLSRIVALDLGRGEGRLLWSTPAGDLPGMTPWTFASSPVAVDDRVLAVVRSPGTESLCGVACLSAAAGTVLWVQPICTVISEADPLWGREALRYESGRVVLNLGGLAAALRLEDGRPEWIVRRVLAAGEPSAGQHRGEVGTVQPLVAGGRVYGFLGDRRAVCLALADGAVLWQADLPGNVEGAIGVRDGTLVVAGELAWGLDAATGRLRWRFGYADPESRGAGPGWLAGDDLVWATREDLFTLDALTGTPLHRLPLADEPLHLQGGWLGGGDRTLFLAAPDAIRLFSLDEPSVPH